MSRAEIVLLIAILVLIVSCGGRDYSSAPQVKVTFVDSVSLNVEKTQGNFTGGLPELKVLLKNNSSESVTVEYRVKCFDVDGMYITDPNETWRPLIVTAKETTGISFIASDSRAKQFEVLIRRQSPIR